MKQRLEKMMPPGFSLKTEMLVYIVGNISAFLWSLAFFKNFFNSVGNLYEYKLNKKMLVQGACMPNFYLLVKDCFSVYAWMLLVAAAMIAFHYASHFQQSKSIYLMRRLPDKTVLYKRCLSLPLIHVALTLLLAALVLTIYYQIYIHFTPKPCLTPGQLEKLFHNWRVLL